MASDGSMLCRRKLLVDPYNWSLDLPPLVQAYMGIRHCNEQLVP